MTTNLVLSVNKDTYAYRYVEARKDQLKYVIVGLPTELQFDQEEYYIGVGETLAKGLSLSVFPQDAQNYKLTYDSYDPQTVRIDKKTGKTTGVARGEATIEVSTVNGTQTITDWCTVYVDKAPSKVSLSDTAKTLYVGGSFYLSATLPNDSASQLSASSSNKAIAKIVQTEPGEFEVTAGTKTGTATLTVKTFNGKTATCKVTVKAAPSSITLNPSDFVLSVGETDKVSVEYASNTFCSYKWQDRRGYNHGQGRADWHQAGQGRSNHGRGRAGGQAGRELRQEQPVRACEVGER